jgi:hypothetical protein
MEVVMAIRNLLLQLRGRWELFPSVRGFSLAPRVIFKPTAHQIEVVISAVAQKKLPAAQKLPSARPPPDNVQWRPENVA